ncbi:unnamed protein product, partial [marine sediment metagenome]
MLFRTLVVAIVVGGPILFFAAPDLLANAKEKVSSLWKGKGASNLSGDDATGNAPIVVAGMPPARSPLEVEGPRMADLGEVFRFDVSTGWIMSRWSRVSTGL